MELPSTESLYIFGIESDDSTSGGGQSDLVYTFAGSDTLIGESGAVLLEAADS